MFHVEHFLESRNEKIFLYIVYIIFATIHSHAQENKIDKILVKKSEHSLWLVSKGQKLYHFKISLGSNSIGHKQREGDNKTPKGKYIIDMKKENSSYYMALHIYYPNDRDKSNAQENGYSAGGMIMIHGQQNGFGLFDFVVQNFDWTKGRIAVKNSDIDLIFNLVRIGTEVTIIP